MAAVQVPGTLMVFLHPPVTTFEGEQYEQSNGSLQVLPNLLTSIFAGENTFVAITEETMGLLKSTGEHFG